MYIHFLFDMVDNGDHCAIVTRHKQQTLHLDSDELKKQLKIIAIR